MSSKRTSYAPLAWFFLMMACAFGALFIFNTTRNATRDFNAIDLASLPNWTGTERINILLLGIDERENQTGPWRTDTIILASIDPISHTASLLSIPRDIWVTIPGYDQSGKINTAHFIGDAQYYPGGGPALAMTTVQSTFDLPVQYYLRLNFNGFEKLIDLIGGIDLTVTQTIDDPLYPDSGFGYEPLHIDAGLQHMDGRLALKYARTRHTGAGDFDRMKRQQQVIRAMRDKVLRADILPALVAQSGALLQTLGDSVKTNLTPDQLLQLAKLAAQIDAGHLRSFTVEPTMTLPANIAGQAALILKPDVARQLRDRLLSVSSPSAGPPPSSPLRPAMHIVQPGETLFSIAQRYNITVDALMQANGLTSDGIYAGQSLLIPR
jgi:LCP family protein required for cell wall assembly